MEVKISMLGQADFKKAVKKYGKIFANAVVEKALQMYADDLDCFDDYAEYDWMQDFIKLPSGKE